MSYHLFDHPCIPCLSQQTMSLLPLDHVLMHSHQIQSLCGRTPFFEFGLYRILLAIILDAYQYTLESLWTLPAPDIQLQRYLQDHRERFDLFGRYPWLQVSDRTIVASDRVKTIETIFPEYAVGTKPLFYNPTQDQSRSPIECFWALCGWSTWGWKGGLGFSPGLNGSSPLFLLLQGETLWDTLRLNCPILSPSEYPIKATPIPWDTDFHLIAQEVHFCDSYLQAYTWPTRSVHLFPTATGDVDKVLFFQGWKPNIDAWRDPQRSYRPLKKTLLVGTKCKSEDLVADWASQLSDESIDPLVVRQYWDLHQQGVKVPPFSPRWYGICTQDAKMISMTMESFPQMRFHSKEQWHIFQTALQTANAVISILRRGIRSLHSIAAGKSSRIEGELTRRYWMMARPALIEYLSSFSESPENAITAWTDTLLRIGKIVWHDLGVKETDLRALAEWKRTWNMAFALLHPHESTKEGETTA